MTLSLRIVKLLADKKPRTLEEISQELGEPTKKVKNSLSWLRQTSMTDAAFTYKLTPTGEGRSAFTPKTPEEVQATCEANRAARLKQFSSPKPARANSIVASAMESQPDLARVWGRS